MFGWPQAHFIRAKHEKEEDVAVASVDSGRASGRASGVLPVDHVSCGLGRIVSTSFLLLLVRHLLLEAMHLFLVASCYY